MKSPADYQRMFSNDLVILATAALTVCLISTNAHAGPPSYGRGGTNWSAIVNQAIRGVQQAQSARSHSNPNYRQQQHYTAPRYNVPQYQPRNYNTTPRYNVQPRQSQPTHRTPSRTSASPAPRTNVQPRINSVPHSTITRRTTTSPRSNSVPTTTVTPRANNAPTVTTARVAPPRNLAPVLSSVPAQPTVNNVTPLPNGALENAVVNLTQADIDNVIRQLDQRDLATLADIRQLPLVGLDEAIDNLPNAEDLSPEDRQRLREAVRNGDANAVRELLDDDQEASAAGRDLADRATAVRLVDDTIATITDGTLNGRDLAGLIDGAQLFPPAAQADVLNGFGQVAVNQQIVVWLLDTQPGVGAVPFGFPAPLALVPGLPQDLLIPLGGGPVLVGAGAPGDAIQLGTGNPWEAAGMPVALPGAEPAEAVEEGYADGIAIIDNTGNETVNYNIDSQPFSLDPEYEQTLTHDSYWIVEFDRGGRNGMAKYTLKPGYYRFKATENGWDLYKAKFECSLDNSGNEFAFQYVLDSEQQSLAPGEIHDLSGDMPPVITFDDGRGDEKKVELDNGTYRVAVGSDQALDIFAADAVSSAAKPSSYAATTTAEPQTESSDIDLVSTSNEKSVASSVRPATHKNSVSLPAGFKLFDPVEALTDTDQAERLPKEFTLFRSAAKELAKSE